MKESKSITEIEQEMDMLADRLLFAGNMKIWSSLISRFNALSIKVCIMKGEQPAVTHGKSDYIV
jgi:hypothetical protein